MGMAAILLNSAQQSEQTGNTLIAMIHSKFKPLAISLKYSLRTRFFNILYGDAYLTCCKKVKDQTRIIIWTNLVDPEYPMLYKKIQPQSFLCSGVEDF